MRKRVLSGICLSIIFFQSVSISFAAGRRGEVLEVKAVKTTKPPLMDGRLNDRIWVEAGLYGGKITGFVDSTGQQLLEYQSVGYGAYDDMNLYIAYQSYEPETGGLVAKSTGENFNFMDDLLQIFLEPELKGRYLHYGINCEGKTSIDIVKASAFRCKDYWSVEVSIPWEKLGVVPEKGKMLGFNIAGQKTAQRSAGSTWITWAPTYGGFHNPVRFGYLILGSEIPVLRKIPERVEEDIF
jgi:hypothetical protein